jgi:hypothetical protein
MYSTHSKLLREASHFSTSVAVLFLAAAFWCSYWINSRGAFGYASVTKTLNLAAGSRAEATFTVPYKGDHDLLIWFSRTQSMTHCDDLDAIAGKAVLRRGDAVVMEVRLPVRQNRFESDGCGVLVWTGPMGPELSYSLAIEADSLPESLAKLQADIRITPTAEYNAWFLSLGLLGAVLVLAALNCTILSVRLRRAGNLGRRDGV